MSNGRKLNLSKSTGILTPENVKLKSNILWDVIELDWKEINVTLNGNKINAPTSVTRKFKDKLKLDVLSKENHSFSILC